MSYPPAQVKEDAYSPWKSVKPEDTQKLFDGGAAWSQSEERAPVVERKCIWTETATHSENTCTWMHLLALEEFL